MNKVEFVFLEINGKSEILDFVNKLPKKDKLKVYDVIEAISEMGIPIASKQKWIPIASKQKWVKKLDSDIYENRFQVGNNIQRCLYFHKQGNIYVITHGFTKKTQKTPQREIRHARLLMNRSRLQNE
ncbi:type II toxin-antitoxin system RelE/ParE family toxin [Companilactobacillus jidongensis]|uniref:type II toxin-antitoxin system RelE/ParE family toxin n=1 Tax=Companilactobacillus jidongensis TaxID=2486006 RepID=UPI000F7AB328|nr:type II toxin-antitoxin system RelE/ParE family toxin [Companilactobacillus jidongensis]